MRRIYLDYAAATPVDPRVVRAMRPFLRETFGNPSSVHAEGRAAKAAIEKARGEVANVLGARQDEIVFTNGVTEAVNMALRGALAASPDRKHIVTVATEHRATIAALRGVADVTVVPVGADGTVDVDAVIAAIRPDTGLVSVMYANNEIGTIAPIGEIGKRIEKLRRAEKSAYPLFHTDAAQAAQYLDLNVTALHVDLMSLSGQKMYGPKATGALFVRKGTPLAPILFGGGQEHGLRPGTENVAGVVGFAAALVIAAHRREAEARRVAQLRNRMVDALRAIPGVRLNGSMENRLPNNVNVSFAGVDGEALVMYLDERGISASTASSCTSTQSVSHVLRALGMSEDAVRGSVRFSLGRGTTARQIDRAVHTIYEIMPLLTSSL